MIAASLYDVRSWPWTIPNGYRALLIRLRHAALMDFDHGVDAGLVRAQQLRELNTLTPWMMAANVANSAIIVLFLTHGWSDWPLVLWGMVINAIGCATISKSLKMRKRQVVYKASQRAIIRAIRHAGLLGALWALLPLLILPKGQVAEQVLTTNVIAGMSAGGAFALAVIPAAAGAYLTLMLVPCLLAIAIGYIPASSPLFFLGLIYYVTLGVTIFARYREFSHRIRDRSEIDRQSQTIALLLKDFEASASDWLWETDADGNLTYVSDRLAHVSRLDRAALVGKSIASTAGSCSGSAEWLALLGDIHDGVALRDVIVPAQHDGAQSWWCLSAGPITDNDGRQTGYRGVGTDITRRRLAELALAQQNQTLATFNAQLETEVASRTQEAEQSAMAAIEANRAKSTFLANMSHEIRTPMNGVFGMTDLLKRTHLTDHQKRLVSTISQSAKSLLTIINDILDISRIEAGKLDIDRHEFDLRQCLEESVELFAETSARKGINLTLYVDPAVPHIVMGDRGRLRQVCVNLIGNSVKFTPSGDVCVRVVGEHRVDGSARLDFTIKDSGIGISPDMLGKLFTPFIQADSSISRRFGGTGLGLSISRHLVGLMGGDIRVVSAAGDGTTLSFTLAFDVASSAASPRASETSLPPGSRLLVVDDRQVNREILTSYLSAAGGTVTAVASGRDGIDAIAAAAKSGAAFAVAIVDVVMPDMDGLEFVRVLRSQAAGGDVQIVLATSMNWAGDIAEIRRLGAQALLTKPVREADLIAAVSSALQMKGTLATVQAAISAPEKTVKPTSVRVLLAEDNPVNIEVSKEYLRGLGCETFVAESGHQALEAFRSSHETTPFDLALMDCQMPDMDGLEATRRIRALELGQGLPRLPIIAVTANAYEEDRRACLAAGMDDYLSKPFTEDELAAVLRKWTRDATARVHEVEAA